MASTGLVPQYGTLGARDEPDYANWSPAGWKHGGVSLQPGVPSEFFRLTQTLFIYIYFFFSYVAISTSTY